MKMKAPSPASALRPLLRKRPFALTALVLIYLYLLTACSGASHEGHESGLPDGHTDNIEVTASGDVLPSFLDQYTETTRDFYLRAFEYGDVLKELNCYCGCMDYANDPHDSLYRCFIAGVDDDGVHWSDHGANCGICLMEVRDATQMAMEGKSIDEIRAHIDATYQGASA